MHSNTRILVEIYSNLARNKVVSTGASVGDNASKLSTLVEDDTVRARRTAAVHTSGAQDRELIVGGVDGEVEVLVVVVDVGVVVDVVAGGLEAGALVDGGGDSRGRVADAAAGVGARLAGLDLGREGEGHRAGEQEGEKGLFFIC